MDHEKETPQQHEDVTGNITPGIHLETDSEEYKNESSTEEPDISLKATPQQPDNLPSGEVTDTGILNSPADVPRDDHSNNTEVDTPGGIDGAASNEECGDNLAENTNKAPMQDVTGDITLGIYLETKWVVDSGVAEYKNESSTEEPEIFLKATPHQTDNLPSGEVKDTEILNSPANIPPSVDKGRGDYEFDGADGTVSNEECGDNSAPSSEATTGATMQGNLEAEANNKEDLSKETLSAKEIVPEKIVETNGAPDEKSTPTSDVPSSVKDNEGNEESRAYHKHTLEEFAAEQNVLEKSVEPPEPASDEKSTPTSDDPPRFKDDEGNGESTANQRFLPQEVVAQQNVQKNVGPTGPAPAEEPKLTPDVPPSVKDSTRRNLWIGVALVVALAAVLSQQLLQPKSPPQKTHPRQIDIFHQEMEKVKVQFPSQREELWKRSRIHLQRHFQITEQTEPVSIILTAGVRAEVTMRCLAQSIASALSSALNVSAIHIDGASKSSQDSDKVKSDIDSQLQRAFEGGKPIAVIHRFEELPPASTLIFYRYCDHENAAFKKTFLIFTVLLGEDEEIKANIRLREVEEMVTDYLQKKFLSNGHPTAFDKMDIDKYGGLWSRISHLILPVVTEEKNCKN